MRKLHGACLKHVVFFPIICLYPPFSNSTRLSQYVTTAGSCKATDDVLEQASCLDLA